MTMCKSLNILLVDDHRVLRTGMKLLLKTQEGFNVAAEASDGKEALQILADKTDIDLVLLDLLQVFLFSLLRLFPYLFCLVL